MYQSLRLSFVCQHSDAEFELTLFTFRHHTPKLQSKMDIVSSLDPLSIAVGVGIGAILSILLGGGKSSGICNPSIMKSEPKVATVCPLKDIEDAVSKSDKGVVAYCRCWRSKKFPYCDGSHVKFNKESGDNTGPLVVKA